MKIKLQLWAIPFLMCFASAQAQNTVTVDAGALWSGYANVFDNGVFQFGSSWNLVDVKSVVDVPGNSITLYPNFNTYNAADPYWANGEIGNKTFEGNTFVENPALAGQPLTFLGQVSANTFAAGYDVQAFIKGLNPATGYSLDVYVHAPLVSGQPFSITADNIPSGLIVQYGFSVTGLNANPAHESALGNAVVTAAPLAIQDFDAFQVGILPNPVTGIFRIHSKAPVEKVEIYNLMGQRVWQSAPSEEFDIATLPAGIYSARIATQNTTHTARIQKK